MSIIIFPRKTFKGGFGLLEQRGFGKRLKRNERKQEKLIK
jgi:hypothetical protein